MQILLADAAIWNNGLRRADILVENGRITEIGGGVHIQRGATVLRFPNCIIVPGFCDVHVHLREPGFAYKETIETGTEAAARGGFTDIAAMPNVNPVPDTAERLGVSLAAHGRARVRVHAVGAITMNQDGATLSDMEAMAADVVGYSDDGRGVQSEALMRGAMKRARALGLPIMAHCEDNAIRGNGRVHNPRFAQKHGVAAIPSEAEWKQVERDIRLVSETGCRYHVQHVSCAESVALIREAKREGLPVTCETAPHYLTLCDDDVKDDGRFIMNPPIRLNEDRLALVEALRDGVIDIVATDHAPHAAHEKDGGVARCAMGIVGLETAFPVLYTRLVLPGLVPLGRLLSAMTDAPRGLINRSHGLEEGRAASLAVVDIGTQYTIDASRFASKGRSTPFDGWTVRGQTALTMVEGRIIYERDEGGETGALHY